MTHGFTIGIERHNQIFFLSMKAVGKLTHEDYEQINPMLDGAIEGVKNPLVYAFLDITELEGWEPRAAWDDFKLGMKHRKEFKKVALYGSKPWQGKVAQFTAWFMSIEIEFFEDKTEALAWLAQES
jgi:hypothetical protein